MHKQAKRKNKISQKDKELRKRQSQKAKAQNRSSGPRVEPCTIEYGVSLVDPFRKDLAPCVPFGVALRSQKICVFSEGSFSTGTVGWGGITVYGALVSDASCCTTTKPSYSGTFLPAWNTPEVDNHQFVNSPYINANLNNSLGCEVRLCSLGVRVRYIGTELDRGGLRYAIQHPEHLTVAGLTASDISSFDFRQIDSQTREWTAVCYTPLRQSDYNFTSNSSGHSTNQPIMGILCESADPNKKVTFEYQVVAHFEAIGAIARGKTISNTDPTGTVKVVSAISQGPPSLPSAVSNNKISSEQTVNLAASKGSDLWSDLAMKAGGALGGYAAEAALAILL